MLPLLRPRRLVALVMILVAISGFLVAAPSPAFAHNTFRSSTPADGASVTAAPAEISMVFAKAVPLESASAEVIEASGARTELTGLSHGPAGDTELIAPLPTIGPGEVTVRWRLVGPDGHPLTGRVTFTISPSPAAAPTVAPVTPAEAAESSALPSTSAPTLSGTTDLVNDEEYFSTPSGVRWLLRYSSYLAIMVLLGVVLTDGLVWPGCASRARLRRLIDRSLTLIALFAAGQTLILASDISGQAPWSSYGSLDAALHTDAGLAFALRAFIAACSWLVLRRMVISQCDVRWTAIGVVGAALMATWAFAGHSASQRWPELGVLLDVVHHTAAATWLGALAIVGLVAARHASADELPDITRRLARTAATAVAIVVATGVVQSVRLVGDPTGLFEGAHGRLLIAKLVLVVGMLGAANTNRKRVLRSIHRSAPMSTHTLAAIRQTIALELGLGLLVIAITSAMVVSSPASAEQSDAGPRVPAGRVYSYTL